MDTHFAQPKTWPHAFEPYSASSSQQYTQQKLAIEQAYKQQHNQLEMAKTQRDMAIQQQAAQMTAQAKQYEMAVEMQKQMASAYGSAYGAGAGAYALAGDVDVVTAAAVASTGALTATFGASAAAALSGQQLARLLGCFMLGVAPVVPYKAQILEAVGAARTPPPATKPTLAERLDQLRADPAGEAAPLLGIGCAAGFLAAVSYTHLTLPTKA